MSKPDLDSSFSTIFIDHKTIDGQMYAVISNLTGIIDEELK